MRLRVSLLLPILLILTALSWASAVATAHPCHDTSVHEQQASAHGSAQAMTVHHGVETAGSGICPAGRCGAYCQMQCAAAIAVPATLDIWLFPGRQVFVPTVMPANLSWPLRATQDPPRPSA